MHTIFERNMSDALNSSNEDNSAEKLPDGTLLLAPIILLELMAAVVSNTLLIALIVKACIQHVQNNTNVYLLSLGVLGLLESFNLFTLFVTVSARRWVFGTAFCEINNVIVKLHLLSPLFLHFVLSRDRYKAVRDPFHWQPITKWAYVSTAVIWALAILYSAFESVGAVFFGVDNPTGAKFYACYFTLDSKRTTVLSVALSVLYYVIVISVLVWTLAYYILVLKDLHLTEKLRIQHSMLSSHVISDNGRDKPLECTAEERAARSLALIFLIQFACTIVSHLHASIRLFESIAQDAALESNAHATEITLWFTIYLFPAVNPVFLMLTNQRFRTRVIDLFKCELKSTSEIDDAGHIPKQCSSVKLTQNLSATSVGKRVQTPPTLFFAQQQNAIPTEPKGKMTVNDTVRTSSRETCSTLVESRQSLDKNEHGFQPIVRVAWTHT